MKIYLFTILLILTAIFSCNVFAESDSLIAAPGFNSEIAELTENGILIGEENGNLHENDELTRAEFATILCRAIGIEEYAKTAEITNKIYFSDVPDTYWAAGYINAACEYGIINGFGDGTFRPEENITNEQVIKLLIAGWGYGDKAESMGGYPNGYMDIAQSFGITDPVLFNYGLASKRWVASVFTYGALSIAQAEGWDINPPVTTTPINTNDPVPETYGGYIEDPVSILRGITPESLKYERKLFEQAVPNYINPLFEIRDGFLTCLEDVGNRRITFTVYSAGVKTPLLEGNFAEARTFDLNTLPYGVWKFTVSVSDREISDTYFCDIMNSDAGVIFTGTMWRYTNLRFNQKTTETRYEIELSNNKTNEHCPFIIKAVYNLTGKLSLDFEYTDILQENWMLSASANSLSDNTQIHDMVNGDTLILHVLRLDNFKPDELYHFQGGVNYNTDGDIAMNGTIVLTVINGEPDFCYQGTIRFLTVEGYEIIYDG